jgi:hypothetical protein
MKIGVMFGNPETTTGGNALKFYENAKQFLEDNPDIARDLDVKLRKIMFPEPEAASAKDGGDGAVEAAAEGADAASEVAEKPAPARKGKSKSRGGDDDEDTGSGTDDELF